MRHWAEWAVLGCVGLTANELAEAMRGDRIGGPIRWRGSGIRLLEERAASSQAASAFSTSRSAASGDKSSRWVVDGLAPSALVQHDVPVRGYRPQKLIQFLDGGHRVASLVTGVGVTGLGAEALGSVGE